MDVAQQDFSSPANRAVEGGGGGGGGEGFVFCLLVLC